MGIITAKKDDYYQLKQRNYFKIGDKIEIITPNMDIIEVIVDNIYNDKMEAIEVANQADATLYIKFKEDIPMFSMLRKSYLN